MKIFRRRDKHRHLRHRLSLRGTSKSFYRDNELYSQAVGEIRCSTRIFGSLREHVRGEVVMVIKGKGNLYDEYRKFIAELIVRKRSGRDVVRSSGSIHKRVGPLL